VKLALRRSAPVDATAWQRFTSWIIRARLVSQYSHAGIVINGTLYHITAKHGAHELGPDEWSPQRWDVIDIGGDDALAIEIFRRVQAGPQGRLQRWVWRLVRGYDWFSLLAFVGPPVRVGWLRYCFELCWLMRMQQEPTDRITPELLLAADRLAR
jgi:hypothetical protein